MASLGCPLRGPEVSLFHWVGPSASGSSFEHLFSRASHWGTLDSSMTLATSRAETSVAGCDSSVAHTGALSPIAASTPLATSATLDTSTGSLATSASLGTSAPIALVIGAAEGPSPSGTIPVPEAAYPSRETFLEDFLFRKATNSASLHRTISANAKKRNEVGISLGS